MTSYTNTMEQIRFNPRSHEGSDKRQANRRGKPRSFNPRSHEGSDGQLLLSLRLSLQVSIHAPTKGATEGFHTALLTFQFQSTLPRRERPDPYKCRRIIQGFQSTLPRRERLIALMMSVASLGVSIHAPTKGATAISAKNSFQFSAKINKLSFYILNFPLFPSPLFSTFHFICAYFRVRIPRHFYVCFLFALLYYHKINVSSTAIPRSTPICSTFV